MNPIGAIYSGIGLCALLLAMHLSSVIDLGYFAYGLGLILVGLAFALTATLPGGRDPKDG